MTNISAEDCAAMQDALARLLGQHCTETDVRRVMATSDGYDPGLWRQMAEMGILGLVTDPEFGGIGAGAVELELLMEAAGAALLPSPWFASGVCAAALLGACTDTRVKARLLPEIVAGTKIVTVALASAQGQWAAEHVTVQAAQGRLNGEAAYVLYAEEADVFLVVAKTADGIGVFEVEAKTPGVTVMAQESFDRTLRLGRVVLTDVAGRQIQCAGVRTVEWMLNMACVGQAGEQVGAARRIFDITIEYVKTRVQFGRPVGGFQAIKHMAADLLLEVESATSAARAAAGGLASGNAGQEMLLNLAAFFCKDTFLQVAATALQMHGGIGFTWEHPCHLYLRRARAGAQLFGSPEFYRDRYVAALEKAA